MRLLHIEEPLRKAISDYIDEVYGLPLYPKPKVKVLDEEEFDKKAKITLYKMGLYDITENCLYFGETATPITVAHEIHHWYQVHKVGKEQFLTGADYWKQELEAEDFGVRNAPRLKWGWPKKET